MISPTTHLNQGVCVSVFWYRQCFILLADTLCVRIPAEGLTSWLTDWLTDRPTERLTVCQPLHVNFKSQLYGMEHVAAKGKALHCHQRCVAASGCCATWHWLWSIFQAPQGVPVLLYMASSRVTGATTLPKRDHQKRKDLSLQFGWGRVRDDPSESVSTGYVKFNHWQYRQHMGKITHVPK